MHSLIPRFHRVYTITLDAFEDCGCLTCDCNNFECNGMVCQHLLRVKTYYAGKSAITHHDISVRWWKAYLYFAMKNVHDCSSTEREMKESWTRFEAMSAKDLLSQKSFTSTPNLHFVGFTSLDRIPMINFRMPQNAA